jgi:hypothetical protein
VTQNTYKNFPRDPAKTLAALMSLRFKVNYNVDNNYPDDVKIKNAVLSRLDQ